MTETAAADSMSGYKVTVTRTLHLLGRYRSRESAEEFGRGLADSGQLAPSDWETAVTVEPLDPDPAADRKRRAAELCRPLMEASDADLRDAMTLIGADKRKLLRAFLRGEARPMSPAPTTGEAAVSLLSQEHREG